MTYPSDDLNGLIERGRQRRVLTTDDLRQALPLDRMTVEDIADVIARLEASGVTVELNTDLLLPNRHAGIRPDLLPVPSPEVPTPEAVREPMPAALAQPVVGTPAAAGPAPMPATWSRAALTIILAALTVAIAIVAWMTWRLA